MQRAGKLSVEQESAILVACLLPGHESDPQDPLSELRSLAETAGVVVVDEMIQHRNKPDATTFIGSGKARELAEMAKLHEAEVVIFDNDLSPSQIARLEETIEKKVIDRSELILDIFAARARTYEARLQVELAQLEYTYPRLRAMWSHLERIVGGAPGGVGTRGPGEQQLEIDRRIVQRRKAELRREIHEIQGRKTREVDQRNNDFFTVGLVGYTNVGKSTLFNTLTGAGAYADDKLFATLSTRTRRWDLGGGEQVMLSDTVGFVRNLPHHLVASFKATLEEAVHSDVLLVVLDAAHPRAMQQYETVTQVLEEIGAGQKQKIIALNKIDMLEHNADLLAFQKALPDAIAISARRGLGLERLVERVREAGRGELRQLELELGMTDGKALHYLETRTQVLDRQYDTDTVRMSVRIGQRQLDQLRAMGGHVRIVGGSDRELARVEPPGWGREPI